MKQNKLVIGIIPSMRPKPMEDPYQDNYIFVDMYAHKLFRAGSIPIGLVLDNHQLHTEQLDMCDAFLLPGGSYIDKNIYMILLYAFMHKKPVLGICLGLQAMCIFSELLKDATKLNKDLKNLNFDDFLKLYKDMAENNPVLVKLPEDNIHFNYITYEEYEHAFHLVNFDKDSFIASYYTTSHNVLCMHSMHATRCGDLLKVVGRSEDNVIEAVESVDPNLFWVGIEFHPEFLEDDYFIDEWVKEVTRKYER